MKNFSIENKKNQIVVKINKKGFDENYLINLIKRLKIEELAQKSDFNADIMTIAEEINQEWWDANGEDFLKGINQ